MTACGLLSLDVMTEAQRLCNKLETPPRSGTSACFDYHHSSTLAIGEYCSIVHVLGGRRIRRQSSYRDLTTGARRGCEIARSSQSSRQQTGHLLPWRLVELRNHSVCLSFGPTQICELQRVVHRRRSPHLGGSSRSF